MASARPVSRIAALVIVALWLAAAVASGSMLSALSVREVRELRRRDEAAV